jgi:hypothetical protein
MESDMETKNLVPLSDLVTRLHCKKITLIKLAKNGQLVGAIKPGKEWLAPEDTTIISKDELKKVTTNIVITPKTEDKPVKPHTFKEVYAKIQKGDCGGADIAEFGIMVKGLRDTGALAELGGKLYTIAEIDEKAKKAFENETKYHELAIQYQEKLDGLQGQERQITSKIERLTAFGKTLSIMRNFIAECVNVLNESRIVEKLPKFPKGITDDDIAALFNSSTVARIINTESSVDESGDEMYDETPDGSADEEESAEPDEEPDTEPEEPKEIPKHLDFHKYPLLMIHYNEEYTGAKKMRLEKPFERLARLALMHDGVEYPKFVDKYDPAKDKMLQKQLKEKEKGNK